MNNLNEFLVRLAEMGVKLWSDGGKLRCSGPEHLMTAELRSELAERKAEILAFLNDVRASDAFAPAPLIPAARPDVIPLSLGQERIWQLVELQPASEAYNTAAVYRIAGPLNVPALEQSLSEVQRRQEILRTAFPKEDGQVRQVIAAALPLVLPVTDAVKDLHLFTPDRRELEIQRMVELEVWRPLDLISGPAWRCRLLRLGSEDHILVCTFHHIIFDGASKNIFLRELSFFYEAFAAGRTPVAPPLPVQYADYAILQRQWMDSEAATRQLSYWKERLSGTLGELALPIDHPRANAAAFRCGNQTFELPDALTDALWALSREEQCSLFTVLLAAYGVLLQRYSRQEDLVLCCPVASRDRAEIEDLIGYFNNIVVMRLDLSADPSFRDIIRRMRRKVLEALENQNLPLQKIAELPNLVRTPLTRGIFVYQDTSARILDIPGAVVNPLEVRRKTADFDLALYMENRDGKLASTVEYHGGIFDDSTVAQLLRHFQSIVEKLVADPDQLLSRLPYFGADLSAIQALLANHPQIDEAVVLSMPNQGGSLAYLVLNEDNPPRLTDIREFARASLPEYQVPVVFVPLDEMPLAPDGSIDFAALPPPALGRARLESSYVAPRTPLENQLAAIWKKVLWLDDEVGVHDRFLELGGHSLLAVQLVGEVESALQRRLPMAILAQFRTVAELAQLLEDSEKAGGFQQVSARGLMGDNLSSPLAPEIYHDLRSYTSAWVGQRASQDAVTVGLNTAGRNQAIFWCLQRYKELAQLAKYLGPEQPIYGMRSGHKIMVKDDANHHALAAHYVGEILAVQPAGPYLIGGNCQAAPIAFQIASQLTALGHEITLLMLQEKFIAEFYAGRVALLFGDRSQFNLYRYFRNPEFGWAKYYSGEFSVDIIRGAHGQFHREPNIQVLTAALRRRIEEAQTVAPGAVPLRCIDNYQRLTAAAYRAKLSGVESWTAQRGSELRIPVKVENLSAESWRASNVSGIALANRWRDSSGAVVPSTDGRTALPCDLLPGSSIDLEIVVTAPMKPGDWTLELDMVEEGITWFSDRGSSLTRLRVNVQRGPRFWDKFLSKKTTAETKTGTTSTS